MTFSRNARHRRRAVLYVGAALAVVFLGPPAFRFLGDDLTDFDEFKDRAGIAASPRWGAYASHCVVSAATDIRIAESGDTAEAWLSYSVLGEEAAAEVAQKFRSVDSPVAAPRRAPSTPKGFWKYDRDRLHRLATSGAQNVIPLRCAARMGRESAGPLTGLLLAHESSVVLWFNPEEHRP